MMQTLLITGATGYLSSHLVRSLVDAGHRVAILKRANSSLRRLEFYVPRLAMFNVEDGLDLPFKSLGHVDTVIHAATCYGRAGEKASEVFEANTAFPLRLLETVTFFNTDTILYKYLNSYSLSKQHFAERGKSFADGGKIVFVNMKLEHKYGVGDDSSKFVTHVCAGSQAHAWEPKILEAPASRILGSQSFLDRIPKPELGNEHYYINRSTRNFEINIDTRSIAKRALLI
jgi:CDP-paratose synthetase